jgi:putative AdoMet-dependent methyltransferase
VIPTTHPWQYDETVQIGTDYQSEDEVRKYDQVMQRIRNVENEAAEIAEAIAVSRRTTVWEIGTGTGECALRISRSCRHIFATDVSPTMLAYARQKADERKIANVTFETGGFLSGFQPETQVDAVVSQLALHHLPDFWKFRALGIISRKLWTGGRLYLKDVVFPSLLDDYDAYFKAVIDEVTSSGGDEFAARIIRHVRSEFSTLDWILEGMLERNGLRVLRKNRSGFWTAYTCEHVSP